MRTQMTCRQRVLTALAQQQPDRVPVNYHANAGIDTRLKAHFGLAADDDEGLRRRLGVDFRGCGAPYAGPRLHPEKPGRHVNAQNGIVTRWVDHGAGGYWDFCDFPLATADEQTVQHWPLPTAQDFDYSQVRDLCRANREFCIHVGGAGTGDIINSSGFLFGVERTMMGLMTEDPAMFTYIDRRLDLDLEVLRRTIEAAAGEIDFMWLGEDLGTQRGPIIGLDTYRRLIRPRHQRFVDLAKSYNLPVMVHTCGSSSWVYEDFIEMGIDVVDTLQPEAVNMSPSYLKSTFGGRLAFHGCISTAGAVSFGSIDDVVREVRGTLEVMMPGGGYCLSPTHALQDNTPVENVAALYEAASTCGAY